MQLEWRRHGLIKHTLPKPSGIQEGDRLLDIGAGLRPINWYVPRKHVCVEPHGPYAQRLRNAGFDVLGCTVQQALESHVEPGSFDSIYLLDVIEHLEREEGEAVVGKILQLKAKQIVVYTPSGFLPQEGDAWGLGGEEWQRHRSGWIPADFPGWKTSTFQKGFFAIWTHTPS